MRFTIPVYVEESRAGADAETGGSVFTARPLLHSPFWHPRVDERSGPVLQRVLSKLSTDLRRTLETLGKLDRHDHLARWAITPPIETRRLKLKVPLRRRTGELRVLVASFDALGRTVAFSPSLPDIWFEVGDGRTLESRAEEVYVAHFLRLEREDDDDPRPEQFSVAGKALVTTVDVDVEPAKSAPKKEERPRAALGEFSSASGLEELYTTGRRLDDLYPDELDRVTLRDREVSELTRLLDGPDRRPVLLVGPPLAGKTAVIHEFVFRRVAARERPYSPRKNTWLLSPQRLVSGMSFVGQWENRLLAILREAARQDHVLYFDDLLGLYLAGQTGQSDLSMADVMRPYVERREFRLLAEMTPDALRVLRERDRGLADKFHILPVREPAAPETLRMLLTAVRGLEGRRRCRFSADVLPTVLDLTGRYLRESAFPGKAAAFLGRMAVKYAGADVSRDTALDEFRLKSGLSTAFLDTGKPLDRADVVKALSDEVAGQPAAVDAMADVVCLAKARLNDPARPLGVMLFLGPTGVGKTQSAKALAKYLFGDAERLLRFDMNEFGSPFSAARLVGMFDRPEGLLTAAVRRQPFCVLLLDEIEKAHPEVFDLLLSLIGEGRLTDALGRTADFGNAIVIMTSNLGVREAGAPVGFRRAGEADESAAYVSAAEGFFRPEFFNRIDRIVPFRRLSRADIEAVARKVFAGIFSRDGLLQRKCVLNIEPAAMDRVVRDGYHPELGARALKRAIERRLTAPVAARLAELPPATPTVISLYPTGTNAGAAGDGVAVVTQGLLPAARVGPVAAGVDLSDPDDALDRIDAALVRLEDEIAELLPEGRVSQSDLRPEHARYFAMREQAGRVRRMFDALDRRLSGRIPAEPETATGRPIAPRGQRAKSKVRSLRRFAWELQHNAWIGDEAHSRQDLMEFLSGLAEDADAYGEKTADRLTDLIHELSLLSVMSSGPEDGSADRVLIHLRPVAERVAADAKRMADLFGPPAEHAGSYLPTLYARFFRSQWGFGCSAVTAKSDREAAKLLGPVDELLIAEGPNITAIAASETGTHLFYVGGGHVRPVCVTVRPLPPGVSPADVLRPAVEARRAWLADLAAGRAEADADPLRPGEVLRLYDEAKITADLRSGLVAQRLPGVEEFRSFLLSRLEPPGEMTG